MITYRHQWLLSHMPRCRDAEAQSAVAMLRRYVTLVAVDTCNAGGRSAVRVPLHDDYVMLVYVVGVWQLDVVREVV